MCLHNELLNSHSNRNKFKMGGHLSSVVRKTWRMKMGFHVLMIGLDNAGKTTTLKTMMPGGVKSGKRYTLFL